MKIIINCSYGGFQLSDEAVRLMEGKWDSNYPTRRDPNLIALIEEIGSKRVSNHSNLRVVEIPDEATDWRLEEYDGWESVIYVLDGKMYEEFGI